MEEAGPGLPADPTVSLGRGGHSSRGQTHLQGWNPPGTWAAAAARETQENQLSPRNGAGQPAWGWEGSISGHTGKTAVLLLSREGAWREQNPESSRILELNKTLAVIKSNPLAKFPTSLTVVCSKVHSTEHWHCGTLTTLPQRGHHQGSLGNAEYNKVKPPSSLQDALRAHLHWESPEEGEEGIFLQPI